MDAADLDYSLPSEAIAQHPAEPRDSARLLVDRGPGLAPDHRAVADLADLLDPDDIVVVNDTKVIPARLQLRKPTGGAVEVLLLERHHEGWWEALVKPGRRVLPGTILLPAAGDGNGVTVEVGEVLGEDGRRRVTIGGGPDRGIDSRVPDDGNGNVAGATGQGGLAEDLAMLAGLGEVPLPPYIHQPLADPGRYQTVFATHPGSVAAPTAGLHLTDALLDRCRSRGVAVLSVELAVGLGTFRPITAERVEDHPMHAERYRIPPKTQEALAHRLAPGRSPAAGGRVIAVGTTVVRALETWAATGELDGATTLFIHGAYPFTLVDRLVTNFHVPRSSLLALVGSFVGPHWRDLYATALQHGYRFLSFGDAMLLTRGGRSTD